MIEKTKFWTFISYSFYGLSKVIVLLNFLALLWSLKDFGFTIFLHLSHLLRLSFTVVPRMHSLESSLVLFRATTLYVLFPIYLLHLDHRGDGLRPAQAFYSYNEYCLYQVSGRYIALFRLLFFRTFGFPEIY